MLTITELSPNVFALEFSPDGQFPAGGADALRTIKLCTQSKCSMSPICKRRGMSLTNMTGEHIIVVVNSKEIW
jgi:hypothetical protein